MSDRAVTACRRCGAPIGEYDTACPQCDEPVAQGRQAGWYPDPTLESEVRWWDGANWSAEVRGSARRARLRRSAPAVGPTLQPGPVAIAGYFCAFALGFGLEALDVAIGRPGGLSVEFVAGELGIWASLVGSCLIVSRRRGSGSLRTDFGLGLSLRDVPYGVATSLAARIAATMVIIPIVASDPGVFRRSVEPFSGFPQGAGQLVLFGFAACVVAPFVEELFFRGLVQGGLVARFGQARGIVFTAAVFAVAHSANWLGVATVLNVVGVFAAGLLFGVLRNKTGRLGPGMIAHCLFNLLATLVLAFHH